MTATSTAKSLGLTANPQSTEEIANAALQWSQVAAQAQAEYGALAKSIGDDLIAGLLAAHFDLDTAADMAREMVEGLKGMANTFGELAIAAQTVAETRADILQMAAGFKKNANGARQYRVS